MMNNTPHNSEQPVTFRTTILQTGKNTTGIEIPEPIVTSLGSGKQPLVRVMLNDYTYQSAVAVIKGKFMVRLSIKLRQAANVQGRQKIDGTLALDSKPRTVELPDDLKAALDEKRICTPNRGGQESRNTRA